MRLNVIQIIFFVNIGITAFVTNDDTYGSMEMNTNTYEKSKNQSELNTDIIHDYKLQIYQVSGIL